MNQSIDPNVLELPNCPLPRPGEKVVYYSGARPVIGELIGHDQKGYAIIANQFGNYDTKSFEVIRPNEPMKRHGPNWNHFATRGALISSQLPISKNFLMDC